ncbi:hypothetical protein [Gilvibacter sp.]|uniref:hypothetical protein n=1 Tax=Gilvibacter sp. TaxID=2729997 RepID=UPI003F4A63D5
MRILLTLLLLAFTLTTSAQQSIITITEKSGKKITDIPRSGEQVVDINSELTLTIDKEALKAKIVDNIPELQGSFDLQTQIDQFEAALNFQDQVLTAMEGNLEDAETMDELYAGLTGFYNYLGRQGTNSPIYKETASLLNRYFSNDVNTFVAGQKVSKEYYVFTHLNEELSSLKTELAKQPNTSYFVSMTAYLQTEFGKAGRVHIENFDNYALQEFYEVPRWVTTLSPDQLQSLKEIQAQAQANNERRADLFEELKTKFLAALPDLKCAQEAKANITAFLTDGTVSSRLSTAVKDKAQELIVQYEQIVGLIETVKTTVSGLSVDTVFEIYGLIDQVKKQAESIKNVFTDFDALIQVIAGIQAEVDALSDEVKDCVKKLSNFGAAFDQLVGILKGHQDRYQDNLELGKEVKRFTVDNMPAEGFLPLKRSGKREDGDRLELNLLLGIPKEGKDPTSTNPDDYDLIKLEPWLLQMQTLGFYSRTYVGLIMADPYNADSLSGVEALQERRFLYAPSAGLLLKVGLRNSRFYNDFLSPGIGISISTPDFDTNGDPEFGTGLVLTAFKNILSIGINYNVTLDVPYWSFGVNLPFNLPGIPINRPQ